MAEKSKMTKDTVPQDFSISLATVDLLPVIFFGINTVLLGRMLGSLMFIAGAVICFLAGLIKVLWKYVVVIRQKNVWWMFVQMRIFMPIGFVLMIIALIICGSAALMSLVISACALPQAIFFIIWIISFVLMTIFAIKLDASDTKSNWIEQLTNAVGQLAFLVGLLVV